ncbi:hypothetical protein EB796_006362 [Bugula neritina]|uniref:Uncharacterized protein n=1 Tax=Bugula neritina TaxID=10212 RepID=A0A7J7K9K6_BUGNE|nr:hypothetical protein EB796_006362 [Bugula neritina]
MNIKSAVCCLLEYCTSSLIIILVSIAEDSHFDIESGDSALLNGVLVEEMCFSSADSELIFYVTNKSLQARNISAEDSIEIEQINPEFRISHLSCVSGLPGAGFNIYYSKTAADSSLLNITHAVTATTKTSFPLDNLLHKGLHAMAVLDRANIHTIMTIVKDQQSALICKMVVWLLRGENWQCSLMSDFEKVYVRVSSVFHIVYQTNGEWYHQLVDATSQCKGSCSLILKPVRISFTASLYDVRDFLPVPPLALLLILRFSSNLYFCQVQLVCNLHSVYTFPVTPGQLKQLVQTSEGFAALTSINMQSHIQYYSIPEADNPKDASREVLVDTTLNAVATTPSDQSECPYENTVQSDQTTQCPNTNTFPLEAPKGTKPLHLKFILITEIIYQCNSKATSTLVGRLHMDLHDCAFDCSVNPLCEVMCYSHSLRHCELHTGACTDLHQVDSGVFYIDNYVSLKEGNALCYRKFCQLDADLE